MAELFEYLDYREFLRDYFEEKRRSTSFFSYRYIGRKIDLDPSNIVKIILGKRHLSKKGIKKLITFLKLSGRRADYFETLVQFNKSKDEKKGKELFERLLTIKNVLTTKVSSNRYQFYKKWYYTAVAALLYYYDFRGDYKTLAEQLDPPISVKQAKESIKLLEDLDFIRKDDTGKYVLTNTMITTGKEWRSIAIKSFQEETLKLALNSLHNHPKIKRDISTLSITVSKDDLEQIKDITREYRESILKIVDESENPDRVYQLNIQLFPLTGIKR
jgi:uncharacterized protein (TIGR02147 family)